MVAEGIAGIKHKGAAGGGPVYSPGEWTVESPISMSVSMSKPKSDNISVFNSAKVGHVN